MGINVLSQFDGISCGQLALQRAGIKVDKYFASEIDKYAIKVTQKNFPNTVQLGDVRNWKSWNLPKIDLFIAGSPCQGFSNAGKGLNFDDPRSKLFFEFVDTLRFLKSKNPNLVFLLENVRMKQEWQDIISELVGVKPIKLNSALVSAQNRVRLYWTNIPNITSPDDKGIVLADILEYGNVDREKSYAIDANYFKGGNPKRYFQKSSRQLVKLPEKSKTVRSSGRGSNDRHEWDRIPDIRGAAIRNQVTSRGVEEQLNIRKDAKSNCVVPSYPHKLNGVVVKTIRHEYIQESEDKMEKYPSLCAQSPESKHLIQVGIATDINGKEQWKRIYSDKGKSPTVVGSGGGHHEPKIATDEIHYRKLTPLECERLQTLPDNYTSGISNTQRYKCIGNGWTADMIAHIFSFLPERFFAK